MLFEALILLGGTAAAGFGIAQLALYVIRTRGPNVELAVIEAGLKQLAMVRGGRMLGDGSVEIPGQGARIRISAQEQDLESVMLGHEERPVFVNQRIALGGEFNGWQVVHIPIQTVVLESAYGDQRHGRAYGEGYAICATDPVVFSLGEESLRYEFREFLGLFGGAHPEMMRTILGGRMPLIPAKLRWNGANVLVAWWTHSTGGLRQQDVEVGLGGMSRFFDAVARGAGEPGGIARLLFERGLGGDLSTTVLGLRVASMMLRDEEERRALKEEALALQADRFRVCLLAYPWEEVEEVVREMSPKVLFGLLEDTFVLAQAARDRGLMMEDTYPANLEALGELIAARLPDASVRVVIEGAPRTADIILRVRGQAFLRAFLCEDFKEHAHLMRQEAMAGFYALAADDTEWDYRGLLRGTPRRFDNIVMAREICRVVVNLATHHPDALREMEVCELILHAIRVGRIEDARVMRDRLLDLGNARTVRLAREVMERYGAALGREREMVFEQLIAVWSARGGESVGGLSIASGEGGELTLADGAGGLSQVPMRENRGGEEG